MDVNGMRKKGRRLDRVRDDVRDTNRTGNVPPCYMEACIVKHRPHIKVELI